MIFVTLGTQSFPMSRLIEEILRLKENNEIKSEIIVQSGVTKVRKINGVKVFPFLSKEEFDKYVSQSELIISHCGTGNVIEFLKKEKKLLVIPRLSKYGEHVDDHQLELFEYLRKSSLCPTVERIEDLHLEIKQINKFNFNKLILDNSIVLKDLYNVLIE